MTVAHSSSPTRTNNLSAGSLAGGQSLPGIMHFMIASTVTVLAFALLAKGWAFMKNAIRHGEQSMRTPPDLVIQMTNMQNPENMVSPIAPLFTPDVQLWSDEITIWSQQHDLDPNLVATVMQIESCGHPEVISRAGAAGLFQVMPYHFGEGEIPTDPDTNAARGLAYFKRSLEIAEGDVSLALAGYNGGHGVITRSKTEWPDETVHYVYWGTGIYRDAMNRSSSSSTLNEWLQAGGSSLCQNPEAFTGPQTP